MTMMTTTTMSSTEAPVQEQAREPQAGDPVPEVLKRFIWDIQSMVELEASEREILFIGRDLMRRLVESPDWLPLAFATSDPAHCQEHQLYSDDQERFTVVSSVLAGAQSAPIRRDAVWEITGILAGPIERTSFALSAEGKPEPKGAPLILQPGAVDVRSAASPEAMQLRNARDGEVAISIHVYGGDIGQLPRRTFTLDGQVGEAPVNYANAVDAPPYDIHSIQTRIVD